MKDNIGSKDKWIRVGIALIIGVLYFTKILSGTAGVIGLVVAGVLLLTSTFGICPIYAVFGLNTCPARKRN